MHRDFIDRGSKMPDCTALLAKQAVSAQHLLALTELRAVSNVRAEKAHWHPWLSFRHCVKVAFRLLHSRCTVLPQNLLVCCLCLCQGEMLLYSNRVQNSPCSSLHNFSVPSLLKKSALPLKEQISRFHP